MADFLRETMGRQTQQSNTLKHRGEKNGTIKVAEDILTVKDTINVMPINPMNLHKSVQK